MRISPCTLLALPLSLLVLSGCERQGAGVHAMDEPVGPIPKYESWGTRLDISDTGTPRLRLDAPYLARFETDSTYTLMTGYDGVDRVSATLFDGNGSLSAVVTAEEIRYFEGDGRFEALRNVIVDARGDRRLTSEHLLWFESERKIRTQGFVRIVTPNERIQGYDLVADEDLATYTLARVTGQVTFEED
jgi:hypothetical protein